MTDLILDRWMLWTSGLIALLVTAAMLGFQNTRQLNEDAGWVAHTHEVMDTLEEVNRHLREAEAAQRTFIITGDESLAAEFASSIEAAKKTVERAKELTKDR